MRTIAIGDIHGCLTALRTLLGEIQPSATDHLVFLGDYIDRGPDSRAVLDLLTQSKLVASTTFLRGNHEVMILEAKYDIQKAKFWDEYGGFDTLVSYEAESRKDWVSAISAEHWDFLKRTEKYFETPDTIFVHACLDSDLDMDEQSDWLLHWDFFDGIQPHKSGKKIICGHSTQSSGEILDLGFAACIDTGCVRGGWLTGLNATTGDYWQANEKGETRSGRLES